MGGKLTFTQEVADSILESLAEGKSLRRSCEYAGVHSSTVLRWLDEPSLAVFAEQYARTRARAYQMLADEIIEISDDSAGDSYTDDDGVEHTDTERVARSKLRVDSRKWMLSKMLPKVYGEKIEHTGAGGGPLQMLLGQMQKSALPVNPDADSA